MDLKPLAEDTAGGTFLAGVTWLQSLPTSYNPSKEHFADEEIPILPSGWRPPAHAARIQSSLSHQAGTETTTNAVSGVLRNLLESSKRLLSCVMLLPIEHFYQFGEFTLDVDERVLLREGKPLALTPKVFETLLILVSNSGRILGKDELMRRLWPDTFVEEANLAFNIQRLRKSLSDDARHPHYIETVSRRGYRFIAHVEEVLSDGTGQGSHQTEA